MKIDAVIFDLDGTLWDSSETVAACWRDTVRQRGKALIEPDGALIRSLMGMTSQQICQKVFSVFGAEGEALCTACLEAEPEYITQHGAELFPGIEDVLRRIGERLPVFIVSNCQKNYIESFLHCSGMAEYIRDHSCEGDTGLGKADNIKLIMAKHGIEHAVYVGDTASDEKSAKAAGCPFIHAAYGFGKALSPVASAARLSDVPELIFALMEDK